ncbi:MAG: carboxypeptidase regulatory-like domain-containing protein [Acidobacteria bacterium]|nr:carboxypeptidase regulatory-like domain-containing protein [Acidobacteriota bacterium]
MRAVLVVLMLSLPIALFAQVKTDLPLPVSGNVTLPLDEFNRLVELASKPTVKPDVSPIPYAIKRADLKLRVGNDSVLGTVQCDGEIFVKGVARIPLLNAPTILDARQAGKALPLEQQGGMQTAILAGPAEFSITLDTGIPLIIDAGRASFNLPVPGAGSSQLSLEIPGEHTNVKINPGIITGRSSNSGRTIVEATLVPGQAANIWWTTREVVVPAAPREARFLTSMKTMVSVNETDLRLAILADVTVVQGEPAQFEMEIPSGFEMTGVTGATLESEEMQSGSLILKVNQTALRNHQFLISMEKPVSVAKTTIPFLSLKGAQRETGEVLVEGEGTMELSATEGGTLKRMDVKETNVYLRSLARHPLHAAFRYHRQAGDPPSLALAWTRFPDNKVLAAASERAVITTLVTSEGRSLTEVSLTVKNQAQPFLKVGLPSGASILTAEVAGEKVKPVQGADGSRVPLLRPGLRTTGSYQVTYVFMHAGAPFAKKGDSELSLPRMDIPISLLQWEVFLPELYKVKDFGGDAISTDLLPPSGRIDIARDEQYPYAERVGAWPIGGNVNIDQLLPGQLGGLVVDPANSVLPGAEVKVVNVRTGASVTTYTDAAGRWVASNMSSGNIKVSARMPGFQSSTLTDINYNAGRPLRLNLALRLASISTMVEVSAADSISESQRIDREVKKKATVENQISSNVVNFQRRAAGDLPIRVDVPRTGNSYSFVRPLVLDEETRVTFKYKSK